LGGTRSFAADAIAWHHFAFRMRATEDLMRIVLTHREMRNP
jgi:hypothetical protein